MFACDYRAHIHGTVLMPEDLAREWLAETTYVPENGACTVQAAECDHLKESRLLVTFDSFVVSFDDDFDQFLSRPVSKAEDRDVYGGLEVYYEAGVEGGAVHFVVTPRSQLNPWFTMRPLNADNCVVADEVLKFLWGDRARYGSFVEFVGAAEELTQKYIEQWIRVEPANYRVVGDAVPLDEWVRQQKGGNAR